MNFKWRESISDIRVF